VSRLVVEIREAGAFRQAMEAGHGGRRPEWEGVTTSLSLSFIGIDTSRPRLDQGLRLEDTFLVVIFAKEPLTFIILEPMVLGVISEVHSFVLKTYFFSVN
jgi:hypothetical protein